MPEVTRAQLAVYAAAAVAIALIGARYLRDSRAPEAAPAGRSPAVRVQRDEGGWAIVQVVGEVRRPGVYRLPPGERVDDAVRRAGGATTDADLAGVNLAAKLEDGRQVIVPKTAAAGEAVVPPEASAGASASSSGRLPRQPLNLNTATLEQLDQLAGVGPVTAQKIVAYRQEHGGFRSVAELGQVPGIGEKRLAALRELVRT